MITWHPDYLYSFDLTSLDNNKIFKECLNAEKYLKQNLSNPMPNKLYESFPTSNFDLYNIFSLPLRETSKLYKELLKYCLPFLNIDEDYWLQSWFNVFYKGKKIDWHDHWLSKYKAWHGFYCVNVEDSYTEYKIPKIEKIIKIPSKEGRLVFGKSNGDKHRSSIWTSHKPRITIAFDIIPYSSLIKDNNFRLNHYLPFK